MKYDSLPFLPQSPFISSPQPSSLTYSGQSASIRYWIVAFTRWGVRSLAASVQNRCESARFAQRTPDGPHLLQHSGVAALRPQKHARGKVIAGGNGRCWCFWARLIQHRLAEGCWKQRKCSKYRGLSGTFARMFIHTHKSSSGQFHLFIMDSLRPMVIVYGLPSGLDGFIKLLLYS